MTGAFAWLYLPHETETVSEHPGFFRQNGIDREKAIDAFLTSEPEWPSFEAFLVDAKAYHAEHVEG